MKNCLVSALVVCLAGLCLAETPEIPAVPASSTNAPSAKVFTLLPFCKRVEGTGKVLVPGGAWAAAEEGRFYPFGTAYRAGADSRLEIAFGPSSSAMVKNGSEFLTREQKVGLKSRTVVLTRGTIDLLLPANLPEDSFYVVAPGFTVKNPVGESRLTYADKGDGDEVVLRCVTGALSVEGRHYEILEMHAADEIRIRTSHDHLSTILDGTSGDYVVRLDQGLHFKEELDDDGRVKVLKEKGSREWHLTPFTKIIINRSVPAIGERMSVHTMAFDAAGERKSECYFCEGRAEVNSGELVASEKVSGEELAKRADEVTESPAASEETAEPTDERVEEE